eukprot:jgi/Galph1/5850/GphlegSOOS_G4426.1
METETRKEEDKVDFYGDLVPTGEVLAEQVEETSSPSHWKTEETVALGKETDGEEEGLDPTKNCVYVSGLGWWFTDEELERAACESNGSSLSLKRGLKEINFCSDPINGKSLGEAYLIFDNAKLAKEAVENLKAHDFEGRKVQIETSSETVAYQELDALAKRSFLKQDNQKSYPFQAHTSRKSQLSGGRVAADASFRGPTTGGAHGHNNAPMFSQKFPYQQGMSAPPPFPFFPPFGFPGFPGMPGAVSGRGNTMGNNNTCTAQAFPGAVNSSSTNTNNNSSNNNAVSAGRGAGGSLDNVFHPPPGFPPIPPHLLGYPPVSGFPPGTNFPPNFGNMNMPTGTLPNAALNGFESSAVQSNMPVSSASSRYTGGKEENDQSEHRSSHSKRRDASSREDIYHRRKASGKDSSKSDKSSRASSESHDERKGERSFRRRGHHESKRSRNSDSDEETRHNTSRRKYSERSSSSRREKYDKLSSSHGEKRSSREERR